jgi:hypothetical protein
MWKTGYVAIPSRLGLGDPLVYVDHDNASFQAICIGPDASRMHFREVGGRKQVFDDTYLHNLLFYKQICSMGQ